MAVATITPTEWGYHVTGGTDPTLIPASTEAPLKPYNKIKIKLILFVAPSANDSVVFTSGGASTSSFKIKVDANDLDCAGNQIWFGENGEWFTNFKVTLAQTDTILYIYTV